MAECMSADDFFTGLFAALAMQGFITLSARTDDLDPAIKQVFDNLRRRATAEELNLRFRIKPHPLHKDSLTIQSALVRAAQRDLICFGNQNIHIKLSRAEAVRVLECLPGGRRLYESLADEFVDTLCVPRRLQGALAL